MSDSDFSYQNPFSPPPPLPPGGGLPPKLKTSGKAIAALLLALLSLAFWIFTAIPAIILAAMAKSDIRREPLRYSGRGLANTAMVIGILGLFVPFVLIPAMVGLSFNSDSSGGFMAKDRIVHLHLSGQLSERPMEDMPAFFPVAGHSLKGLLDCFAHIHEDDSVRAVLITMQQPGIGSGQIEELWRGIRALDADGIPVYIHGMDLQTGGYSLASAATHINVVPTDTVWLLGLQAQALYFAEALEKIGVHAEVLHTGDYKSAGEMFDRNGPSETASENMNWLLDGLYDATVGRISEGRGIDPDRVRALIDDGPYTASQAEAAGLIDSVLHLDDLLDLIREEHGEDLIIDNDYDGGDGGGSKKRNIAVIFAEGAIARGYSEPSPFGGGGGRVLSGDMRRVLKQAADDSSIHAVVLRIDSPGGSAVASEEILDAVELIRAEGKPVVVSMGSTAASGGYYIACTADAIYAEATTLTASIGVVGGKIATQEMWDDLGIHWHTWKRGANADLMDITRPFTDEQREKVRGWMEDTYAAFKNHVVEGRGAKLTRPIEDLAGGRVYTGAQALDLGLVDTLGGLEDAIGHAAELADLSEGDYGIRVLPEYKGVWESLIETMNGDQPSPTDLAFDASLRRESMPFRLNVDIASNPLAMVQESFPGHARAMQYALTAGRILAGEPVLALMPTLVVIE